ncbi:MAG: hypothetical protein J5666_07000 [Bacilli bacterium]|nr:hypothetical protein [Bacilli bacterium]
MEVQEILSIIFGTGLTISFLGLVATLCFYFIKFGFKREKLDIELRENAIKALKKYLYPCSWLDDEQEGK